MVDFCLIIVELGFKNGKSAEFVLKNIGKGRSALLHDQFSVKSLMRYNEFSIFANSKNYY